jgi:hypothetical protein
VPEWADDNRAAVPACHPFPVGRHSVEPWNLGATTTSAAPVQTGNLRLEWKGNGGQVRLERAENVDSPYSPLTPITTDQAFEDASVLTNRTQRFYRLRQYWG